MRSTQKQEIRTALSASKEKGLWRSLYQRDLLAELCQARQQEEHSMPEAGRRALVEMIAMTQMARALNERAKKLDPKLASLARSLNRRFR